MTLKTILVGVVGVVAVAMITRIQSDGSTASVETGTTDIETAYNSNPDQFIDERLDELEDVHHTDLRFPDLPYDHIKNVLPESEW